MTDSVLKQITNLKKLNHEELKALYTSLHGSPPQAYNRDFIVKRLAYRLQELAFGGASTQTLARLDNVPIEHGYDENGMHASRKKGRKKTKNNHPIIGTMFIREWRGERYEVCTLPDGFEFRGKKYTSLTAVAMAITGTKWNGKAFFGLANSKGDI